MDTIPRAIPAAQAVAVARRQYERCAAIEHDYGAQLNEHGWRLLRRAAFAGDLRDLGAEPRS